MEVNIKVAQSRQLFESISLNFGALDSWAMRFLREHGITCRFTYFDRDLVAEDFFCFSEEPTIVLAEVRDGEALNTLNSMSLRLNRLRNEQDGMPYMVSPFIALFHATALSQPSFDLPDFLTDWVLGCIDQVELTHRILRALRTRKLRKIALAFGELLVLPDSRSISLGASSVRLSPAEFALAELFLARFGSVISLSELATFFKSTGKSTELSNIRVTIHQLRLKLEELTKSKLQLATIYRKGYCLRQCHRPVAVAEDVILSV